MDAITVPGSPTAATISGRKLAVEGARDITPMIIGVLPLGLAIGAAIGSSSIPPLAGWLGAPLIFGGAAQLSTVQMLEAGAAPLVIIVSALLVNARVLMYGAAIAPWFRSESLRRRLLLAVPLIDPVYFTSAARFERGDLDAGGRRAYYAGAALSLAAAWLGVQAIAITAGATLPDALGLHIAAPLAFVGLLARALATRPAMLAALVAAAVAVLAAALPFQAAVIAATAAGIAGGRAATTRLQRRQGGER